MRSKLVVNPTSGPWDVQRELPAVLTHLEEHGWHTTLHQTERPGEATQLAQQARDEGLDAVFVVGGDGTINEVVNGLVDSSVALAVLPGGTGNVWAKELGLPTWDKPSFACLSSRFPYHTKITESALRQVEAAEDFLWNLGMREFRVRHHDTIARIELGEKELSLFLEGGRWNEIVLHLKSLGYKYVTLDLEGYRSGSMNEALSKDQLSLSEPNSFRLR